MFPTPLTTLSNALCGAALLASSALAQELPSPTIDADTLGFAVGMSAEDVLARIQADYPGVRARITEGRHQESGQNFIYAIYLVAGEEKMTFYFTGHFSGNRLYGISREARFPAGERPSAAETRQQLIAKYGLPTYVGGHTLYYNYGAEGQVRYGTDDQVSAILAIEPWSSSAFSELRSTLGNDSRWNLDQSGCHRNLVTNHNAQSYRPLNPDQAMTEGCVAVMKIETPAVDGLLGYLKVYIGDFQFVAESALIDQANDTRDIPEASGDPAKL